MPGHYTKEELDRLDKQALIMLLMSMQDQLQQMYDSLNRLTEQIAAANQYRFGRHSEKMDDFKGQLSIFDLLNEAEYTVETASDLHEPDAGDTIITYRRKKSKGKRNLDLKDLPVEKIDHTIPDEKLHEIFGDKWKTLPDEVYKRLAYEPAKYVVHEHHVKVYAGNDNQTIVKADRPMDLLRSSIVTPLSGSRHPERQICQCGAAVPTGTGTEAQRDQHLTPGHGELDDRMCGPVPVSYV